MADVKRASSGPSFPVPNLKKKPPNFSNHGFSSSSSSFKHIYDDVFGSSFPSRMKPSSSFMEDDYAEVFGSSKSSNGAWNMSYSSIPVLDLPMKETGVVKQGTVDYGGVFGGVGESGCFGLPDGEELFDHLKKKHKTSPSHTLPRSQGQGMEASSLDISSQSYDGQSPANGFCQSFDNMKRFKSGNKMAVNATSEPKKASHIRASSLHEVSATLKTLSCQEPVIKDDMLDTDSKLEKKQGIHARHTSLDFGVNNRNSNSDAGFQKVSGTRVSFTVDTSHGTCQPINFGVNNQYSNSDAGFQKVSGMKGSCTVNTCHDTCQPSNTSTNGFCQSSDNTKRSEYKISKMSTDSTCRTIHAADAHILQESNCSLDELEPNQKILSSSTPVLRDEALSAIDVNLEQQGKHSCSTSLDLGANRQNEVYGNVFQKACGWSESTSETSPETCQASVIAEPSKVVKDDTEISIGCNELKKGRRSKMNSLDLGNNKLPCEHDDGLKRKPRYGHSYSFDASHDPCVARIKVQPSKIYPSSSLPQFFPVDSLRMVSENSSCKNSQKNLYRDAVGSPPSLAEDLDVNSVAAVSAAALQRAIEEAEMRIRLAKAFLERECQGSTNLSFKDTLKVKIIKENGLVNEVTKFKHTKMHESSPPIDSDIKPCSPLERKNVVKNGKVPAVFEDHAPPVFEDQKKFVTDEELTIRGDDKHEGEWEAAKHLNQLITGVKNRLASFISWQTETETEKKEETKEVEAIMKPQQRSEEVKHDLKDHETSQCKKIEDNQGTIISSCEEMHGESKTQSASEAQEPEENESFKSFDVVREKTGNTVDVISDTAGPRSANFQFFAFRNQILCDPPDPEVEEKKGPEESSESEIENEQEQVMNEVKNEHIHWQDKEARLQESDDKCVTRDIKWHDDMYKMSDVGSCDEENEKTVEEPCSQAGQIIRELSLEEDGESLMKGDSCSVYEVNVEMLEEHHFVAGHVKVPTHEEGRQVGANMKSHVGSFIEEDNEILKESNSLAENDEEELSIEHEGQGDILSNDENNEIVKKFCFQAGHERNNIVHEEDNDKTPNMEFKEKSTNNSHLCEGISERIDKDDNCEVLVEAENQHEKIEVMEELNLVEESWKNIAATEGVFECQENDRDQRETNHIEEFSGGTCGLEKIKIIQSNYVEETPDKVTLQASCIVSAEEGCKQNENVYLSAAESCSYVESYSTVEKAAFTGEGIENMVQTTNIIELEIDTESPVLSEKANELIEEEPVLSSAPAGSNRKLDRNGIQESLNETNGILLHEHLDSFDSESDISCGHMGVDVKVVESESPDNLENQTDFLHDSGEKQPAGEFDSASDQDAERSGVEAGHRRRRWFDNSMSIGTDERPSILESNQVDLDVDLEVLDESELAGSVEIHADKLDCKAAEVTTVRDVGTSSNQDGNRTNIETTPTRKKWFVKRREEGVPEPLSLFEGIKVNLEVPLESANESTMHNISGYSLDNLKTNSGESLDAANNGEKGKLNGEAAPRRRRWFEFGERVGPGQHIRIDEDVGLTEDIDQESIEKGDVEKFGKLDSMSISQKNDDVYNNVEPAKEHHSDLDDLNRKEKDREKEKIAVEKVIREARERAFAEARERARRDAAERPNVETRPKVVAGVQEKLGKVSSEATSSLDKVSMEAKLKAERAAVERATAEARERALQKALSEKASHRPREQAGRYCPEKNSSLEPKYQSSRCSDSSNTSEKYDGADVESAQRRKARLERQKRTMERATNALEEKSRRDLLAQKEQAAKNMLADSLDAEVKKWSTGKEGNLRALLSTLQYILGPDSGWQPVSLTDLVAATAVRKSYKKATLCVHPDKLQQRGATIQQKYICEKVFDLLKEAWSKFNPDER